jgi:hypothetical protein
VTTWLSAFDDALAAGDPATAAALSHQSRHYSLFLALQLKAREAGIPTPVYGLQQVHHLS